MDKINNGGLYELIMDAQSYQRIHEIPAKILSLYKIPVAFY